MCQCVHTIEWEESAESIYIVNIHVSREGEFVFKVVVFI